MFVGCGGGGVEVVYLAEGQGEGEGTVGINLSCLNDESINKLYELGNKYAKLF